MTARKLLLAILVFSTLAGAALAADFAADTHPQKDVIFPDEIAYFTLTVTNLQQVPDYFTVYTPEYDWLLDTDEPIGELQPQESRTVVVQLTPKDDVPSGPRAVRVRVRSANSGDSTLFSEIVTVRSPNSTNRTYAPSVFLSADVDKQIDPREPMTVSVYMRNRNARVYDKLEVTLASDLFTKDYTTALGPTGTEGEKTNAVSILLDPHTTPGEHKLAVTLSVDNSVVNRYETTFTVIPLNDIQITPVSETKFFKTTTNYTVTNNGNTVQDAEVLRQTSFIKRLFTSATVDYDVESTDDGSMLVFTVPLNPNEQAHITVVENYRLLFLFAVIVALSILSYFFFRSPVVLRKEALIFGTAADGVSHIKIRLFIKNRSAKAIHNIHVIDKVTSMADVVKEASLGTLHPTKIIRKKGHGTLVRWDIDTLDAFEERIITYQVRTELKLIGDVYLPAMKVKFDQAGRERTSYSNEVNIPREG